MPPLAEIPGPQYRVTRVVAVVALGMVEREMQTAAFATLQGRADDELGDQNQIAQFEQIARNAEVAVELTDLRSQQIDAAPRAL